MKWLPCKPRRVREEQAAIDSGIGPVIRLENALNTCSLRMLEKRPSGRLPEKKLVSRYMKMRFSRSDIDSGSTPERLFDHRLK